MAGSAAGSARGSLPLPSVDIPGHSGLGFASPAETDAETGPQSMPHALAGSIRA